MSQAPPTRRRWLQVSLGTMFLLVTVFAVWLAWEAKIIRGRKAFLEWIDQQNKEAGEQRVFLYPARVEPAEIAFWRRWLGDQAVDDVALPAKATADDRNRAKALFPEADIRLHPEHADGDPQGNKSVFE